MKRHSARRALLLLPSLAILLAAARADAGGGQDMLGGLHYGAAAGVMTGVGPQGRTLRRGPFVALNVVGESAIGMQLGVEGTFAASDDFYRTRFASLGLIARFSPTPEDYRVFVQLGASIYHVSYDAQQAGALAPGNTTRPGGSFGIGLDLLQTDHYSLGGIATYNGVILARSDGRSYIAAALQLTFKPSAY